MNVDDIILLEQGRPSPDDDWDVLLQLFPETPMARASIVTSVANTLSERHLPTSERQLQWCLCVLGHGCTLSHADTGASSLCVKLLCSWLRSLSHGHPPPADTFQPPEPLLLRPFLYCGIILSHLRRFVSSLDHTDSGDTDGATAPSVTCAELCHTVLISVHELAVSRHLLQLGVHAHKLTHAALSFLLCVSDCLLAPPYDLVLTQQRQLASEALTLLFDAWICVCAVTFPDTCLWSMLYQCATRWRHRTSLVRQWSEIVYRLTQRVVCLLYVGTTCRPVSPHTTSPTTQSRTQTGALNSHTLVHTWYLLLHVMGDLIELSEPAKIASTQPFLQYAINRSSVIEPCEHACLSLLPDTFQCAVTTVAALVDQFLVHCTRSSALLHVLDSWLFRGALLFDAAEYWHGAAICLSTLCRLFGRHTDTHACTHVIAFYTCMHHVLHNFCASFQPAQATCQPPSAHSTVCVRALFLHLDDVMCCHLDMVGCICQLLVAALCHVISMETTRPQHDVTLRRCSVRLLLFMMTITSHYGATVVHDLDQLTLDCVTFADLRPQLLDCALVTLAEETDGVSIKLLLTAVSMFLLHLLDELVVECNQAQSTGVCDHISSECVGYASSDVCRTLVRIVHTVSRCLFSTVSTDVNVCLAILDVLSLAARVTSSCDSTCVAKSSGTHIEYDAVDCLCTFIRHQCDRPAIHHSRQLHTTIVSGFLSLSYWIQHHRQSLLHYSGRLLPILRVVELGVCGVDDRLSADSDSELRPLRPVSRRVQEVAEFLLSMITQCPQRCACRSCQPDSTAQYSTGCQPELSHEQCDYHVACGSTILCVRAAETACRHSVTVCARNAFCHTRLLFEADHAARDSSDPGRPVCVSSDTAQPSQNSSSAHLTSGHPLFSEPHKSFPSTIDEVLANCSDETRDKCDSMRRILVEESVLTAASTHYDSGSRHCAVFTPCERPSRCYQTPTTDSTASQQRANPDSVARLFISQLHLLSLGTLSALLNTPCVRKTVATQSPQPPLAGTSSLPVYLQPSPELSADLAAFDRVECTGGVCVVCVHHVTYCDTDTVQVNVCANDSCFEQLLACLGEPLAARDCQLKLDDTVARCYRWTDSWLQHIVFTVRQPAVALSESVAVTTLCDKLSILVFDEVAECNRWIRRMGALADRDCEGGSSTICVCEVQHAVFWLRLVCRPPLQIAAPLVSGCLVSCRVLARLLQLTVVSLTQHERSPHTDTTSVCAQHAIHAQRAHTVQRIVARHRVR